MTSIGQRIEFTMSSHQEPTTRVSQTPTMLLEPQGLVEKPSRLILTTTIMSVTCATFVGSLNVGILTIEIPSIAKDAGLDSSLLLW